MSGESDKEEGINSSDKEEGMDSSNKEEGMDSSGQEIIATNPDLTNPAVGIVFRMDNIVEEICSHLGLNDLKQFRLVSMACNNEGRRALIKRDRHWAIAKDDDWRFQLEEVVTKLEETASDGGESSKNLTLRGWIFKRLEVNNWKCCLEQMYFLEGWDHYLRKIHLKTADDCNSSDFITTIHHLLTVSCPNLEEMVVHIDNLNYQDLSLLIINQVESLDFPSPLLKLKCLRVMGLHVGVHTIENIEFLQRFITKLVRAAGTALEILEIEYPHNAGEERMLESLSLNVDVNNFQSLQEISLVTSDHVATLSHLVKECFPKLTKLMLDGFFSTNFVTGIRSGAFPALKSLEMHFAEYEDINNGRIVHFLQHFSNLEVVVIDQWNTECPGIPDPVPLVLKSMRSFTLETEDYDLRLLRCVVDLFPNLVKLDLLRFGRKSFRRVGGEPEYSFRELIDIISPLNCLKHLYVNHAFHTSTQLVNAIQLTSNLAALQTFVLSQAAHDYARQEFNVSLYLTTSDPDFLYILDCDCVKRLELVRLLAFRFGTMEAEVEKEAAAKGGHVSFGPICHRCLKAWI